MSPGVRTIPAAMVLPTAAAMPNQTPRTWNNLPRGILEASGCGEAIGSGGQSVCPGASERGHDNGGGGKWKAEVMGHGQDELRLGSAINRREIPRLRGAARSQERTRKKRPRHSARNDRSGLVGLDDCQDKTTGWAK